MWKVKISEKWQGFWAELKLFVVLPKLDQNIFFQKFKKDLVEKSLKQQKMARDIDFRAPSGREYLCPRVHVFHVSTVKSRNNQIKIFL
jgi:hypothetical protein